MRSDGRRKRHLVVIRRHTVVCRIHTVLDSRKLIEDLPCGVDVGLGPLNVAVGQLSMGEGGEEEDVSFW